MSRAVFVLAGGRSSRMGRDKAMLPMQGHTLVQHVAAQGRGLTDKITLIGDSIRYANLGYPVIQDIFPGSGPLGGLYTALIHSDADWNLIVACDLPQITTDFLVALIQRAEAGSALAVVPVGPDAVPQPLCAAYHRRCAPVLAYALEKGVRKVIDGLTALDVDFWPVSDSHYFRNLNTPQEWADYSHAAR